MTAPGSATRTPQSKQTKKNQGRLTLKGEVKTKQNKTVKSISKNLNNLPFVHLWWKKLKKSWRFMITAFTKNNLWNCTLSFPWNGLTFYQCYIYNYFYFMLLPKWIVFNMLTLHLLSLLISSYCGKFPWLPMISAYSQTLPTSQGIFNVLSCTEHFLNLGMKITSFSYHSPMYFMFQFWAYIFVWYYG